MKDGSKSDTLDALEHVFQYCSRTCDASKEFSSTNYPLSLKG